MPTWKPLLLSTVVALCIPATASAMFEHVVAPGESLSSVAATDGLSIDALAAANGISPDSQLIAGASLAIPPQDSQTAAPTESAPPTVGAEATAAPEPASTAASAPVAETRGSTGGYVVAPGDTLWSIAARYGTTVQALAADNGLDPHGLLLAGTNLSLAGSAPAPAQTEAPAPTAASSSLPPSDTGSSSGAQPTPQSVSPSEVGSIAAANGVSSSLAEAIANQESGFNNDAVSSTGATGVMQIEPGTWDYIGRNLTGGTQLSPVSASDNIRGGVLLLRSLLNQTGGDPGLAAAGYYQGLGSVREHGLYSDTQRYVNDVMALQRRFGGP